MQTSPSTKNLDDSAKQAAKERKEIANYIELATNHLSRVLNLGVQPMDVTSIERMYVHLCRIHRKYKPDLTSPLDTPATEFSKRIICQYVVKIWVATEGQLGCPDEALFYTLATASHAFNVAIELLTYTKRNYKVQLVDKSTNQQLAIVEIKGKN